jgi:hypothetical protein
MARSSSRRGRLLLFGAVVVAVGVLLKREKVAGLLPSRAETYSPPAPGPSNYDAPGPVANTATAVPVPEAYEPEPIDEAAEEAAAAAEAANIGGSVSDYGGPSDLPASEAERPLAEAGEGESEGLEQAELDLEHAAEPSDGMSSAQHQIEDTIEQAANPLAGEQIEESASAAPTTPQEPAPFEPPAAEPEPEPEAAEPAKEPEPEPASEEKDEKGDDDGGSDWRTWSGRSINP